MCVIGTRGSLISGVNEEEREIGVIWVSGTTSTNFTSLEINNFGFNLHTIVSKVLLHSSLN